MDENKFSKSIPKYFKKVIQHQDVGFSLEMQGWFDI